MRNGRSGLALGLFVAALQTAAAAQAPLHYVNAQFGFSVDIPAGFSPKEPPANGDGLRFESHSGDAVITATAVRNVVPDTMTSFMAMSNETCLHHQPSYVDIHTDWAVLSCLTPDGHTLYQRSALRGPADDAVFTTVRMTYPSRDHVRWDRVAVAVTRSLRPAPGG